MAIEGDISHLRTWGIQTDSYEPEALKYFETVLMQGNGYIGTRGAFEEVLKPGDGSAPLTLIAGIFDTPNREHMVTRLAPAPNWLALRFFDGYEWFSLQSGKILKHSRSLTYRNGVLKREVRWQSPSGRISTLLFQRFVSMARPNVCAISLTIIPENYSGTVKIASELRYDSCYEDGITQTDLVAKQLADGIFSVAVITREEKHTIAEAMRTSIFKGRRILPASRVETPFGEEIEFPATCGEEHTVEKTVCIYDSMRWNDPITCAEEKVKTLPRFRTLHREQCLAWKEYWRQDDIKIEGDTFAQSVARFFVFELLQAASKANVNLNLDVSIAAKCMSGPGYNGHVFWDTELYMLPFFTMEFPEIAKKLLEHRYNRLPQAEKNAELEGGKGAKFPWESAGIGVETTPKWLPTGDGGLVRCWTGDREIHVIADIAMGAWQYYLATGDEEFMEQMGLQLILETGRYWAYRAKREETPTGYRYVINEVIPPNEYHECVNNSFFTNALARWNIQKALELIEKKRTHEKTKVLLEKLEINDEELSHWEDVANRLKIPYDENMGLYAESDGFFELEDVIGKEWSHERCNEKQMIKQADVLMALYLLPDLANRELFQRHYDYYVPRTDHGSSLSPGVHVLFSLMASYPDKAYEFFQKAGSIDAARRGHSSDSGLHAASLGGGWQAIIFGFGGVRATENGLSINPELPNHWSRLKFRLRYQGARIGVDITKKDVMVIVEEGDPVRLQVLGQEVYLQRGETLRVSKKPPYTVI